MRLILVSSKIQNVDNNYKVKYIKHTLVHQCTTYQGKKYNITTLNCYLLDLSYDILHG